MSVKKDLSPYFQETFSFLRFQDKRWATASVAFCAGIVVLIVYLQSGPKPEAFAAAEEAVSRWEASQNEVSYQEMKRALSQVPALEKKYEAVIAQKLFAGDQISEALELAHRSLSRVREDAPFHVAYGETTLLIEQGDYQDALEKSVGLKEQMAKERDWGQMEGEWLTGGTLLYAHNLLRIAFLQQELKNNPGEKAAWDELESFLKKKENLASLVIGNFQEKGLDLSNYIAERKKQL
jgi:chaperonin cofactor prefoldin